MSPDTDERSGRPLRAQALRSEVSPSDSARNALAPRGGVSIVIATHDRSEKLRALLSSLRSSGTPMDRLVIVDDSPHPAPYAAEFPELPIRHVVLPSRVFLSRARNVGLAQSTGDVVYFIDDDNVVTRETLEAPLALLNARPEVAAVMPSVLYRRDPRLVWVYATPLSPSRWGHRLVGRNSPRNPDLEGRLWDTDALPNAFAARRAALEEIGGFNEAMAMSSSADLALRLKARGWKVLAHSGVFAYHDVAPPGSPGYWGEHGALDADRVYHDVRDWFLLMKSLHRGERWFVLRAMVRALRFVLPNALAYALRGDREGRRSLRKLAAGYFSGMRAAAAEP